MLAGTNRLSGTFYIERAKKNGKMYQFTDFGLCVHTRNNLDDGKPTRFAFVVSTKVAKHAVDRNRVKRVISETVRYEALHLKTGYDVVFLTKPSIATRQSDIIMSDTKKALFAASLLKK